MHTPSVRLPGIQCTYRNWCSCVSIFLLKLQANPDSPSSQMRNFTVDSRHLVLLKNFALPGELPVSSPTEDVSSQKRLVFRSAQSAFCQTVRSHSLQKGHRVQALGKKTKWPQKRAKSPQRPRTQLHHNSRALSAIKVRLCGVISRCVSQFQPVDIVARNRAFTRRGHGVGSVLS